MKKLYTDPWQWCRRLQKTGIIALSLLGAVQSVNAQVSNYAFTQSTGTFNSITSSGTLIPNSDATTLITNDSAGWTVALPFNFNFNGADYSSIYVNSNGGATFGTTTSNVGSIISSSTGFSGAIGVMSRDLWGVFVTSGVTTSGSDVITNVASFKGIEIGKQLNNVNGIPTGATITAFDETAGTITMSAPATSSSSSAVVRYGSGKIFTTVEGTAPNRVFVIEWIGYNDFSSAITGSNYLNFQLRLAETSNRVSIIYGPSYNVNTTSRTNQIGLRGASNADFNNRSGAAGSPWDSTIAGTTNSASVSRDSSNFPVPGLTFTWVPPTCYVPTALAVPLATVTPNGASVSWTAPSIVPATGYEVYYSTSNTSPTSSTVLDTTNSTTSTTTSASINGLLPSTTYYVWVRSACSGSDKSVWSAATSFSTACQPPAILSVNGATVCGASGSATISATADAGATITWYDAATGGNVLSTGNSYTTPVISANTTYYVSAKSGSNPPSAGLANAISTTGYTLEAGLFFDAASSFTINGVYVYPIGTGPGTVVIALQDGSVSPAVTLQTITVNLTGTTAPYVKTFVPLNFSVTPGSNYKLMMMSRTGGVSSLVRESGSSWGAYPLSVPGVMTITSGNCCSGNTTSTSYYYFYDWQLTAGCESARQPVNVVVNSSCLGTSETSAKDAIKVYPNPFSDILNVSDIVNVKSISVTDLGGRLIKTIEKPSSAINLSDLQSGLYMITLYLKDGSQKTVKTIKK